MRSYQKRKKKIPTTPTFSFLKRLPERHLLFLYSLNEIETIKQRRQD